MADFPMTIGQASAWRAVLKAVGWSKAATLTMPTGEKIPAWQIRQIKIVYTQQAQAYLPQRVDVKGQIASVGVERNGATLILRVQADPTWLAQKSGQARDWRVAHQAVWMLYRMTHGQDVDDAGLAEIFGALQDRNLVEVADDE